MKGQNLFLMMRLAQGLTQEEMAIRIGVNKKTIAITERAQHITNEMKGKLLRTFELDDKFFSFVENYKKTL